MKSPVIRASLKFIGVLCALVFLGSCDKGKLKDNEPPHTSISIDSILLSGEDRLNSVVQVHWWGTDLDGVVEGFEVSLDNVNWQFTRSQDSTFLFSITAGNDTVDIDLWIRAIDDDGAVDETPAYLSIPLKNTPPEIEFQSALIPDDTSFNLVTLAWKASDLDGFDNLEAIELKINTGEWVSLSKNIEIITIVPDDASLNGTASAHLYTDSETKNEAIEGLQLNAANEFYIRARDIAGAYSIEDTISDLFVTNKTSDLLVIGANSASPNAFYKSNLTQIGQTFDFIDFVRDDAKNQPRIWSPTFSLLLQQYDAVIMYANDVTYTNAQTNAEDIILEFAATSIQEFTDGGGKLWLNSSFPNAYSTGSSLFGILPIDSFSTSDGLARLPIDSLAIGELTGYPDLTCEAFISGLDPFYPSSDADVVYTAQLTKNNGWEGPDIIAARRKLNGNTNFIMMTVELHKLNKDPAAAEDLFTHVLTQEFNW